VPPKRPDRDVPALAVLPLAIGAAIFGVGMQLSNGCGSGTLAVAGAQSGSLYGFLWVAAVLPGSWLGIRLRPVFGVARTA